MSDSDERRPAWKSLLKRGTLGRRILVWFLIVSLLPLLVSNTVGYAVSRRILADQLEHYLVSLAEVQAAHVAHELDRHRLTLETIVSGHRSFPDLLQAAVAAFRSGRPMEPVAAPLAALLQHELTENPAFDEFFVLGPGGYAVAATRDGRLETNWSDNRIFMASRAGPVYELEWENRGGNELPVFLVADPVLSEDGRRLGVFVAASHFENEGLFLHIPPLLDGSVKTLLVAGDGRPLFVSHSRLPLDFANPLPSSLAVSQTGPPATYLNSENEEVLGASALVPGTNWRCIAEMPVELALGQLGDLRRMSTLLEGVFALLLVFVVWLVVRSIVLPLMRLVVGTERMREGALGVTVEVTGDDEIGQLARTFNQMSSEVERSAAEIKNLHDKEMLRASQLATVGELASGIAHEIKNPMAGISSGLDLLERESLHDHRVDDLLAQVRQQLRRMETAVGDLLRFARPREPQLVRVDPADVVDRALGLIGSQADATGVSVEYGRGEDPVTIMVDPEQLTQAIVNLGLNAIQAMAAGGRMSVALMRQDGDVRIVVADTGGGIPPEMVEEVFRPFVTTKHRGTGLGLPITRGIVERNGGRMEIDSELGRGSRFAVVFPVCQEEEG